MLARLALVLVVLFHLHLLVGMGCPLDLFGAVELVERVLDDLDSHQLLLEIPIRQVAFANLSPPHEVQWLEQEGLKEGPVRRIKAIPHSHFTQLLISLLRAIVLLSKDVGPDVPECRVLGLAVTPSQHGKHMGDRSIHVSVLHDANCHLLVVEESRSHVHCTKGV